MIDLTIDKIENAFLPAKEINEPEKFSGREEHIKNSVLALIAEGANIAIVGNRGIGKSSLARQIANISRGYNTLLEKLNMKLRKLDFLTVYFTCGNSITSVSELLYRLLTTKDCLHNWLYDIPQSRKEVEKLSSAVTAGIPKIFGASVKGENVGETSYSPVISQHEVEVVFQNVISSILEAKLAKDGILIIIDEFDQIKQPEGFASYLKSLATNTPGLKFCIVGVAQDIQNLMKEHESADRLFAGSVINLPPMSSSELRAIIVKAELSIERKILFHQQAIDRIIQLAQGHPYIVHLIGKIALRSAYEAQATLIDEELVNATLRAIAEKEADPVLEGRYKKAVASSPQRESVLKAMALSISTDGEILTTDAYKLALEKDVDNPSQYVGQLVTAEYGAELIKVRERYYRFKDSLFSTYVKARPSIFP